MSTQPKEAYGPFRADQIRHGDPYELSRGHPIRCLPASPRHARGAAGAAEVLDSDPAVEAAAVDAGFTPDPGTLRAPDVAVGNLPDRPGWAPGAPALAVEYADTGQDEAGLQVKIAELLAAGTRYLWVVRLVGPQRVEVYEPGAPVRTRVPGEELTAPGVLRNPVPVLALFDRSAAREVTLRNLLQRHGYESLDAVRGEGRAEGLRLALRRILAGRGFALRPEEAARIDACADGERLERWIAAAMVAGSVEGALDE